MCNNRIKTFLALALLSMGGMACADKEEVYVTPIGEERYEGISQTVAFVSSPSQTTAEKPIIMNNEGRTYLYVHLNKVQTQDVTLRVSYAPEVLESYNSKHKTEYKALPAELVTLVEDVLIAKGERKSAAIDVTFKTSETLEAMATYAIPLRVQTVGNALRALGKAAGVGVADYVLLVKDVSKLPSVNKTSGMEIFSCMEVNDANPLSHLSFTLKKTQQPLFNHVILFSSNINFDAQSNQAYIFHNPNVAHLLNNREKYLKPLQDRGIKVHLSILGNHDRAGVANLSDEGAKAFAQEIKKTLETYQLDGVMFDDEYSNYSRTYPGFASPGRGPASRLCYETKQAIGDKLVIVYVYGQMTSLISIDGKKPGEYVDYALHDYQRGGALTYDFEGLPVARWGLYSQELGLERFVDERWLTKMYADGSRTHMVFGLNPFKDNLGMQLQALGRVARAFFGDEVSYDNKPYKKDW